MAYPNTYPTLDVSHADGVGEPVLAGDMNGVAGFANAAALEFGLEPSGGETTLRDRLDRRTEQIWTNLGNVTGTVTLPFSSRINTGFLCRPTGTTTFVLSGMTEVGQWVELYIWQSGGPHTITLPSAVWPEGDNGAASGGFPGLKDRFGFHYMGPLDMHGFIIGNNFQP